MNQAEIIHAAVKKLFGTAKDDGENTEILAAALPIVAGVLIDLNRAATALETLAAEAEGRITIRTDAP